MRKEMRTRNVGTVVMALALSVVMGMTAVADSGETVDSVTDFATNTATTDVKILSATDAETNLSATLPLKVTLAVKPSGAIVSPTAYKLTNTSQTMKIKVTNIAVTMKGNYATAAADGKKNIGTITVTNSKSAAVKTLAELSSTPTSPASDADKWTLSSKKEADTTSGANEMVIRFSGSMDFADAVAAGEDAFKLVYTIAKET